MSLFRKKFWEILENLYVGAEPEGKSGYVNILKQKHKYFENFVKPQLSSYIKKRIKDFPEFEEELYKKLYTFFEPYFSESGAIFFAKSYIYLKQYERVYGKEDVKLFWKTKDLYYIKSDVLVRSAEIPLDENYVFFFDASEIEHKTNNEKRKFVYKFNKISEGKIFIKVSYKEGNIKTKLDDITKAIKQTFLRLNKTGKATNFKEEYLKKAIRIFEKQTSVDYFIHKNAEKFLKEQFNLWLSQYLLNHEEVNLPEKRINQLLALKDVAYRVIEVIAHFENELKRLWEKPRLVFDANYVVSLDRIAEKEGGIELIKEIVNHPNFDKQIEEWKRLNIVDKNFRKEEIVKNNSLNSEFQFLPIDTVYFKDLEKRIVNLFDLDEELDGLLINSENFQALNTILPRFKGKIQLIYIDPPYNTGSDEFQYADNLRHASWLSFMNDRLTLARELLSESGSIYVNMDYNEVHYLKVLMDEIFGRENFQREIIWRMGFVSGYKTAVKNFIRNHDTILFYSKDKNEMFFKKIYIKNEEFKKILPETKEIRKLFKKYNLTDEQIDEIFYQINHALRIDKYPLEDTWNCNQWDDLNSIAIESSTKRVDETIVIDGKNFKGQKPEKLLKRIIESSSNQGDFILDFFLGSGTTIAAAHKLRRKWIGIEMDGAFFSVVLDRMKRVLAYDNAGISNHKDVREIYNKNNAGGFFKYYKLEQFEEVLRNVEYEDTSEQLYNTLLENDKTTKFSKVSPFLTDRRLTKAIKIEDDDWQVDFKQLYPDKEIDLIETAVNVLGLPYKDVKKMLTDKAKEIKKIISKKVLF
jgi:adenine-specific DNA-methyltransferase